MRYIEKPDKFSSQSQIAELILSKLQSKSLILDVGCASGFLGKRLSGKKFRLYGIDNHQEALDEAKPYYQKLFLADLEDFTPENNLKFDLMVFADVLEHLKNPQEVLVKFVASLKDDGVIIISLPNIANILTRLMLLVGRFRYMDAGIMDKTHLRFFTLATARELIEQSNLKTEFLKVTPLPLPLISPLFAPGKILCFPYYFIILMTNIFKTMMAYQFIFMTRKK